MTTESSTLDSQLQASKGIVRAILSTLATERGVHAETAVAAAARMAGTLLFRTFGLPTRDIAPGTPILSEIANERGPVLVEVLQAALTGLGVEPGPAPTQAQLDAAVPQLTLLETQRMLDAPIAAVIDAQQLSGEAAARACALAAASLIAQARGVLAPSTGFRIAVDGFVESCKTMPPPAPQS